MLTDLQNLDLLPMSVGDILVNLLVAFLCGMFIAWLYKKTTSTPGYPPSFLSSMVLLTLITAMVIMIIGNSLARAFGLVGAMSIIRFRTAVKETLDIVFIFFSLAAGLAAGAGAQAIALVGTVAIGGVVYLLARVPLLAPQRKEYFLQFSYDAGDDAHPAYIDILDRHCKRQRLVNASVTNGDGPLQVSFYI
ncbi:MAG: DUF4956 domain-containing protein, partial [Bacteroidetes bacterium]|nr:DUF4956 domain-containing protein [Bacteroidota bacterium]